jgi:hypothetical protein
VPANEPLINAIADRIRAVLSRQSPAMRDALACELDVSPNDLRRLIDDRDGTIDPGFLIDAIAALVRECAVDPQWLLTGEYDSTTHCQALLLREDPGQATNALREFVRARYLELRQRISYVMAPTAVNEVD